MRLRPPTRRRPRGAISRRARRRRRIGRRVAAGVVVALALALVWTAWLSFRAARDLRAAEQSFTALSRAVTDGNDPARDQALADLRRRAAAAHDVTDGLWWGAMTHAPVLGDDAHGVEALSAGLDEVARNGLGPLVTTLDQLDAVSGDGGFHLPVVEALQTPVGQASASFARADADVAALDPSGFVGPLRGRYEEFAATLHDAASGLAAARTATEVVPALTGADGPRDYLLVLQNNAEIRSTGGIGGSWAHVHAEDGRLTLMEQGGAGAFPERRTPVLPLTSQETAVYGPEIGRFFQDPGFTPDFPRAAQLWAAFWDDQHPRTPLDGVVSVDPVGMSYLLRGTGPVGVASVSLTADNVVEALLSTVYNRLSPPAQNAAFQLVVKNVFTAVTGTLSSPYKLAAGLQRATDEGRFHLAVFGRDDGAVAARLAGTRVGGALSGDDGATPHVDVGFNDATASKMSYYLRYRASVSTDSCAGGVQQLTGTLDLAQTIDAARAAGLADYVTGGGTHGVPVGSQLVQVRLYGPWGGDLTGLTVAGTVQRPEVNRIDGRPETTVAIELDDTTPVTVRWTMASAVGQTGDARLHTTPGVAAGDPDATIPTAC